MRVIHSDQTIQLAADEPSIFLAGPTPRDKSVVSWRIEALEILEHNHYIGAVFVPECSGWQYRNDYTDQVNWEEHALTVATCAVFWIPRKIPNMLGLTTNVEFGRWITKKKYPNFIYGRPDDAEKCRYLDWLYMHEMGCEPYRTLESTLLGAIE